MPTYFIATSLTSSKASRVGHLRFTFSGTQAPYVFLEATRASVMGSSDPSNVTYPSGTIAINPAAREITGSNPERQDFIIGPNRAEGFSGYFVARFDASFVAFGTVQNGTVRAGDNARDGTMLGGYAVFPRDTHTVDVRIGVSFISVEQARRNLDKEIPDGTTLEQTARTTRAAWAEKLDRVQIQGGSREQLETFYTALFHTLQVCVLPFCCCSGFVKPSIQYPYEQDEDGQYYSGYDDKVHEGVSYTGYSIWVHIPYPSLVVFDVAYAGYLSCSLGLADPLRPRAYTWYGAKYVARLQGGTIFKDPYRQH